MEKLRIVLINILIGIILFVILDFLSFNILFSKIHENFSLQRKIKIYVQNVFKTDLENEYVYYKQYRKTENEKSKKAPILIFGCSYAYGYKLDDNSTFSYRLGELTGRPVYNRARPGMGPQYTLYLLKNEDFYKTVPKPEYVIYVLNKWHIERAISGHHFRQNRYVFYKPNTTNKAAGLLVRDSVKEFLYRSYLIYIIKTYLGLTTFEQIIQDTMPLKLHLLEIKRQINSHWGEDVKVVLLIYERPQAIEGLIAPILPELKNEGFIIVNINDLSNKDFKNPQYTLSKSDGHPNSRSWKELTPLIVKKLGL